MHENVIKSDLIYSIILFFNNKRDTRAAIFIFFITIEFFITSLPITMTLALMSEKEGLERRDKYTLEL